MDEEMLELEQQELLLENRKLMKKSRFMIISFFTLIMVCLVLFVILQKNKFFIFNINRSFENVPNPFVTEIFSLFFVFIIFLGFISYIALTRQYIKRYKEPEEIQLESFSKYKKLYNLSDIFSVVPIFLVIVMVVNGFFFSFAQVDGISMEPTFCSNDIVIIQYVPEYHIQDIVILEENNMYLIKRLIAKAGDTIKVDATGVYVNNVLIETYLGNGSIGYSELVIPEGFYYVMGDNRENSQDSRFFGLVKEEDMYGQVILKLSSSTCELDG